IFTVTPMAILEEDLAAFPHVLQIRRSLFIPGIAVDICVLDLVGVFSVIVHTERALGRLKHERFPVNFRARWRCRMHRTQLDRFVYIRLHAVVTHDLNAKWNKRRGVWPAAVY